MKKGGRVLTASDYYQDNSPEIIIPLDPLKTPQQNAAKYYKDYNRQKSAGGYLTGLIEKGEAELDYRDSVLSELKLSDGERELALIRQELETAGFLKKKSAGKKQKKPPVFPMRFISDTGLEILVGKNNTQNDELTFKTARRSDIWLHTQKIHGSHVILRCGDSPPDESSLSQAAALAALYSDAKSGGRTAVDLTNVKFVKKPAGAMPGMVIYSNQKTILSEANEELSERLRKK
jgi:predicted ribosome quality control (RQC) complex YloA/Tae2 family protein